MQGGTAFLVEPISGIERQQLDFRSFGQVGGFVNDQPAGLHSSLQCHSDHSSTAKRRTTSWLRVASSSLVFAMSAMAGEGRTLVLPSRYPVATRIRKRCEIVRKSARINSVRDRGVGGSNPLAPTKYLRKTAKIQSGGPLGFTRVANPSNRALRGVCRRKTMVLNGNRLGCC